MILLLAIAVIGLVDAFFHLYGALHFFQIQEYDNRRYLNWSLRHLGRLIWVWSLIIIPLVLVLFFVNSEEQLVLSIGVALWGTSTVVYVLYFRGQLKSWIKPLVLTSRVKRLFAVSLFLVVMQLLLAYLLPRTLYHSPLAGSETAWGISSLVFFCLAILIPQLGFLTLVLANILLYPYESYQRRGFISSAQQKLEQIKPIVIGITGSYGKTTTKEILYQLLETRYHVLKTPKSFNTMLGICKVINEQLEASHEIFIAELGAYKTGEIKELCELVQPTIGILTAIGPQHLERFKTIENVARAKFELIESLPNDGIAIFNCDDQRCCTLSAKAACQVKRYGTSLSDQPLELQARDTEIGPDGTSFDLYYEGEIYPAQSNLLGRHNVLNTLGALLAALEFDFSMEELARGVKMLDQVESRLQLRNGFNGSYYLDNSYNSNPLGASLALEILSQFEGTKYLVTPGFVELGEIEAVENKRLGERAAAVCDYVFLIGPLDRTASILQGLENNGFADHQVFQYTSLDLAVGKLREMVKPQDVILFENDLPDIYIG